MIAEPYICLEGPKAGSIEWIDNPMSKCHGRVLPDGKLTLLRGMTPWQPYTDFEREKLKQLGRKGKTSRLYAPGDSCQDGWQWTTGYGDSHMSGELIGYASEDYFAGSESSRLLKRAEFLKAVCEKEGVEWLSAVDHRISTADAAERIQEMDRAVRDSYKMHPDRDYYTKGEIDKLLDEHLHEWKHERQHYR